jgi:hypothetical protein
MWKVEQKKDGAFLEQQVVIQLVKKPVFYGAERSLPFSKKHVTGPYPEPDEFSTRCHTLFLLDLILYYPKINKMFN